MTKRGRNGGTGWERWARHDRPGLPVPSAGVLGSHGSVLGVERPLWAPREMDWREEGRPGGWGEGAGGGGRGGQEDRGGEKARVVSTPGRVSGGRTPVHQLVLQLWGQVRGLENSPRARRSRTATTTVRFLPRSPRPSSRIPAREQTAGGPRFRGGCLPARRGCLLFKKKRSWLQPSGEGPRPKVTGTLTGSPRRGGSR